MIWYIYIYLYYKDKKQLKTFLTQIGSTIPFMLDSYVRIEESGREGKPIKITRYRAAKK